MVSEFKDLDTSALESESSRGSRGEIVVSVVVYLCEVGNFFLNGDRNFVSKTVAVGASPDSERYLHSGLWQSITLLLYLPDVVYMSGTA